MGVLFFLRCFVEDINVAIYPSAPTFKRVSQRTDHVRTLRCNRHVGIKRHLIIYRPFCLDRGVTVFPGQHYSRYIQRYD